MTWQGLDEYERNQDAAAKDLGHALFRGELALFLGAGVSMDSRLPNWLKLVKGCSEACKIDHSDLDENTSAEKLRSRTDSIEASFGARIEDYHACIHDALYKGFKPPLTPTPLLQALGALTMGSKRGSVTEVLTLNFDDILEQYLGIHGFLGKAILDPHQLRGTTDVNIFHVNGFLPHNQRDRWSDKPVTFSEKSFDEVLANEGSWKAQVRTLLTTKVVLSVGLSLGDSHLRSLITDADVQVKFKAAARPAAFWLTTSKLTSDELTQMRTRRIVPLIFSDHKKFPDFLLSICQEAAEMFND